MKKVVIIGGGISGLTAGIYALQNGYEVEIYEKNPTPGGECSGWNRNGYHIDNCIHWLTGCREGDGLNKIWKNIGALEDSTELIREPYFYMLDTGKIRLHLWSELERAREEFLSVAPEDSAEINKFFDSVRLAECMKVPSEKSLAEMNFIEYMKFGMSMTGMGRVIKEYGDETIEDLGGRFKNPVIRDILTSYLYKDYKAITFISSYSFYTSGTAAIPKGGSVGMISRIVEKFKSLGGRIYTNKSAEKINIYGKTAVSADFTDGTSVKFDYVICACDGRVTFGKLIDESFMDKKLQKLYGIGYTLTSNYNASFGVKGRDDCGFSGSTIFPCQKYKVATKELNKLGARLYDYDEGLFPSDKRVIQCNIIQTEEDYEYWNKLYDDKTSYKSEKLRIAEELKNRLETKYPQLKDRIVLLDTFTPITFTRWCKAYKGSYMSFFEKKGSKSLTVKNRIKGLNNVIMAGQWVTTNGGLPIAAASGKFAIDALKKCK